MSDAPIPAPKPLAKWRMVLQLPGQEPFVVSRSQLLQYYTMLRMGWDVFGWAMSEYGSLRIWEKNFQEGDWRSILERGDGLNMMFKVV